MSGQIKQINEGDFDSLITIPRKSAVVFFTAEWSGASQIVKRNLETAAKKYVQKVEFYELNIDDNPLIAQKYGIRNVPVMITFAFGEISDCWVGPITRDDLNEMIEKVVDCAELYKNAVAFSKKIATHFSNRFRV